jgi:hypothetical protein
MADLGPVNRQGVEWLRENGGRYAQYGQESR